MRFSSCDAVRDQRNGFTLIELLVVIAIIAILIGLLVPAVQKVRESAARTQCTNNLKQLSLGCHNYNDVKKGLPPARIARDAYATWPVLILPFVEQDTLYKTWDIRQGFSSQTQVARETALPIFFCPTRRRPMISPGSQNNGPNNGRAGACGDYGCCAGNGATALNQSAANGAMINGQVLNPLGPGPQSGANGIDQPNTNPPSQPLVPILQFTSYTAVNTIRDGTSNTFLLGEKHVRPDRFGQNTDGDQAYYSGWNYNSAQRAAGPNYRLARSPEDNPPNRDDCFGSYHPGFCLFAFCDGSVRAISVTIDLTNLGRLANRIDGQVINASY